MYTGPKGGCVSGKGLIRNCLALSALVFLLAINLLGCVGFLPHGSHSGGATQSNASLGGNGEGFEGIIYYAYNDPQTPCADRLPYNEMALYPGVRASMLRSQCVALATPTPIAITDLTFATDGTGDVTYQGLSFTPEAQQSTQTPAPLLIAGMSMVSAWTSSADAILTPNLASPLAPDGTATATGLAEGVSTGPHLAQYSVPSYTVGSWVRFYLHVKAAGRTAVFIQVQDSVTYTDSLWAVFDLASGTQVASQITTGTSYSIEPETDGWYRIGISGIVSTNYSNIMIQFGSGVLVNSTFSPSTGDGTSGIDFWGGQFQQY